MRHFEKGPERASLREQRDSRSDFKHLLTPIKDEIRSLGYSEQGGLCAFCCAQLLLDSQIKPDSSKTRIAHLIPRHGEDGNPSLQLEYTNMVISCSGRRNEGRPEEASDEEDSDEASCDLRQGSRPLRVTPLQEDCQARFQFDVNGRMWGKDEDAETTLKILGLDCERLRVARRRAFSQAMVAISEAGEETFRSVFLSTSQMPLTPFLPMLEYLFPPTE